MSSASNNNGRAYEYVFLHSLYDAISKLRQTEIVKDCSYEASQRAWNMIDLAQREVYKESAISAIDTLLALEPNIIEDTEDTLSLYIQPDSKGVKADVRDIIVERADIKWQIGLSIKHNHMAVKHSRISRALDFGMQWYGVPCSHEYWQDVHMVFEYLEEEKAKGTYFRDIPDKEQRVYLPLLNAFIKEVSKQVAAHRYIPKRLVEYLLSKYDFYKVISVDKLKTTIIQSFNMYGTLNRPSKVSKPTIKAPKVKLPTKLIHIGLKENSSTTALMCLNRGWQFSFRLHNAKDMVEPSLKFDIQIVGMPVNVNVTFECKW